jgi:hypothetical protein
MIFTKDVWVRAFKTGIEALITYLLASLAGLSFSDLLVENFLLGLGFGAFAAFITALLNAVLEAIKANKGNG